MALTYGAWRLRTIRTLIKQRAPKQQQFEYLDEHPIIRSLSDYGDLVRDFLHDEAVEGQDKVLARYLKPDLLIIDDMGMKPLPKRSGEYVFEIIMRRYETRSTMMTSNRPLEDWGKRAPPEGWSGDVPSATAILDRFLHHAEIIQITGNSYRLRNQAAQNQEPNQASRKAKSAI